MLVFGTEESNYLLPRLDMVSGQDMARVQAGPLALDGALARQLVEFLSLLVLPRQSSILKNKEKEIEYWRNTNYLKMKIH